MASIVKIKKMILQADAKVESAVIHHIKTKEIVFPETIATVADAKAAISAIVKAPKGTEMSSVVLKLNGKEVEDAAAITASELKTSKVVFKAFYATVEAAPVVEVTPEAPVAPEAPAA